MYFVLLYSFLTENLKTMFMSKSYPLGRDSLTVLWELLISKEVRSQKYAISNLHVECTYVWKSWLIATICTENGGVIEYPLLRTYTPISIENFLKIQVLPRCRARLLGAVNPHRLCGPLCCRMVLNR